MTTIKLGGDLHSEVQLSQRRLRKHPIGDGGGKIAPERDENLHLAAHHRFESGHDIVPMVPWRLAEVMRRRLDGEEQAIFGMSRAGIAPVEIAATLGVSASGLESRMWDILQKLENMDAELPTSDPPGARSAARAR